MRRNGADRDPEVGLSWNADGPCWLSLERNGTGPAPRRMQLATLGGCKRDYRFTGPLMRLYRQGTLRVAAATPLRVVGRGNVRLELRYSPGGARNTVGSRRKERPMLGRQS
jgi:hypothetical protein